MIESIISPDIESEVINAIQETDIITMLKLNSDIDYLYYDVKTKRIVYKLTKNCVYVCRLFGSETELSIIENYKYNNSLFLKRLYNDEFNIKSENPILISNYDEFFRYYILNRKNLNNNNHIFNVINLDPDSFLKVADELNLDFIYLIRMGASQIFRYSDKSLYPNLSKNHSKFLSWMKKKDY